MRVLVKYVDSLNGIAVRFLKSTDSIIWENNLVARCQSERQYILHRLKHNRNYFLYYMYFFTKGQGGRK